MIISPGLSKEGYTSRGGFKSRQRSRIQQNPNTSSTMHVSGVVRYARHELDAIDALSYTPSDSSSGVGSSLPRPTSRTQNPFPTHNLGRFLFIARVTITYHVRGSCVGSFLGSPHKWNKIMLHSPLKLLSTSFHWFSFCGLWTLPYCTPNGLPSPRCPALAGPVMH